MPTVTTPEENTTLWIGLRILLYYTTAADSQHTGELVSLHSLLLSYARKRIDYKADSYNARIQLALEEQVKVHPVILAHKQNDNLCSAGRQFVRSAGRQSKITDLGVFFL